MIEHQVVAAKWSPDVKGYFLELGDQVFILKLLGGPNSTEPHVVKKAGRPVKRIKPEGTSAKKGDTRTTFPVAESTPVTEEQKGVILKMAAAGKSTQEIIAMLPALTKKQIRETRKSASAPGTGNTDPNLFKDV